jgi:hypothetical protein
MVEKPESCELNQVPPVNGGGTFYVFKAPGPRFRPLPPSVPPVHAGHKEVRGYADGFPAPQTTPAVNPNAMQSEARDRPAPMKIVSVYPCAETCGTGVTRFSPAPAAQCKYCLAVRPRGSCEDYILGSMAQLRHFALGTLYPAVYSQSCTIYN